MFWERQEKRNDENKTIRGANAANTRPSLLKNDSKKKNKSQDYLLQL